VLRTGSLAVLAGLAICWSAPAEAECPPRCDLASLIDLAESTGPGIASAEARVGEAEAVRSEAYAAPLDLGSASVSASPAATHSGDPAHSEGTDESFSSEMGLLFGLRIEVGLVLTPWWRIATYWRASRAAVELSRGELERTRAETRLAVERAYRDAQVAVASAELLRLAQRALRQELARIETALAMDLAGASEQDRLRLLIDQTGLDARRVQVRRDRHVALARLRRLSGLQHGVRIEIDELGQEVPPPPPLDWCLEAARLNRPEVRMTFAGIRATEALVSARQSEFVPDLAIGAYYAYRTIPVSDDQMTSFAHDPWNGAGFGYGLVYQWELGIGARVARLRQARADVEAARAMRRFALGGVAYEVEDAHARATEDAATLEARRQARDIARSWLDRVRGEHARREADADALSDAFGMWMSQELAYVRALARLHQGRAELARATGTAGGREDQ
jgi:outer membrane protein TolC